jgi:hypothetical protein
MYWFKRKWRQIKRVIDFLPIIWKGYDWDYRYAVELFQHQLLRTAKEIKKRGNRVDRENVASRIETAVEFLEKVYEDEYAFEYARKIEETYGPSRLKTIELDEIDNDGNWITGEMIEVYEREYTKDELQLIQDEKDNLRNESYAKQKRAHKLVWKYIEHNIQGWWD